LDGVAWAQRDMITPRTIPADWWQPDQVISERYVLTTTDEIPFGAYQVNVSLRHPESNDLLPLRQNHDPNSVDRVLLGYVAVPWSETGLPEAAVPVGATFGDQIRLIGYAVDDTPAATLYWEALRPLDNDYTVFVHLVDEKGEMVANYDSRPMGGRYTTLAWLPGHIVPDGHPMALPAALPPGPHLLRVGLYLPETGDRLPVTSSQGQEQPNGSVLLPIGDIQLSTE
jgi:hypothetical protein